ncbi:hypothetical protein D7X74_21320 [Corallococcus sp. CA047B]|uniref:hypothetical protein n=1 Tax=Corallococcus sp. CA047B TaxID=2316729 RepID=UPI000EA128B0|nr:hypothetical protein [Corallococcus sp. CA047B]RKH13790.1 hypothetical protein D7X74_21320 [Corallococcus sp. CA047B]
MATKRTAKRDCEKGDCGTTTCRACALRVLTARVEEARRAVGHLQDAAPERALPHGFYAASLMQVEALLSDALASIHAPSVTVGR